MEAIEEQIVLDDVDETKSVIEEGSETAAE